MSTLYHETLCNFKQKVSLNQFWKFYKIKVVIVRESEKEIWKIILLSILPTGNESIRYYILLEDSAIKIIEETRSSDSFEPFLSELFTNQTIRIGDTDSSNELIRFEPLIKRSNRFTSMSVIGVEYPGDILYVTGVDPKSDDFNRIKRHVERRLLIHDPPY
jgi:hypothetical protein